MTGIWPFTRGKPTTVTKKVPGHTLFQHNLYDWGAYTNHEDVDGFHHTPPPQFEVGDTAWAEGSYKGKVIERHDTLSISYLLEGQYSNMFPPTGREWFHYLCPTDEMGRAHNCDPKVVRLVRIDGYVQYGYLIELPNGARKWCTEVVHRSSNVLLRTVIRLEVHNMILAIYLIGFLFCMGYLCFTQHGQDAKNYFTGLELFIGCIVWPLSVVFLAFVHFLTKK